MPITLLGAASFRKLNEKRSSGISNRSTNTNEQTTRSGTNEKISILDEDSRTIGGGSCYNKERGALGGSGSLVSRAIARFNNDTKHISTVSDEKQETSSKKYTFQKSNSSGSIKRGQSLKIPASYTGNSSTDHQVNSGTGSKSSNSAMLTNLETQNSVSSTNSKYQGSDDAQDYRNSSPTTRNKPIRSVSNAGVSPPTSNTTNGYSWKRKANIFGVGKQDNSVGTNRKSHLYETSIEEDQTLDTGQPNNETLDSLSQPGHHPGQKQFKNTKLRSSNSGHSNQTSRKSSSNSKPSASQKSSSLIKYFSGEKTNYSTSNSPITNNSEKSHDSGVVRVSDPRFSESDSCKKKLQRTCHPRDYGEKDLAENMDYKNTHQRDVERELRASENSLYQNSSESFKERDKPQTKIISQQRAIKKTGRTNEKVIPFCSKYRTYGDGQELVGRAESGVNEGNNKNMRYEGSSATAATGKCISTGTGSNNGVANKLTYKIQRCNSMPVRNKEDKDLRLKPDLEDLSESIIVTTRNSCFRRFNTSNTNTEVPNLEQHYPSFDVDQGHKTIQQRGCENRDVETVKAKLSGKKTLEFTDSNNTVIDLKMRRSVKETFLEDATVNPDNPEHPSSSANASSNLQAGQSQACEYSENISEDSFLNSPLKSSNAGESSNSGKNSKKDSDKTTQSSSVLEDNGYYENSSNQNSSCLNSSSYENNHPRNKKQSMQSDSSSNYNNSNTVLTSSASSASRNYKPEIKTRLKIQNRQISYSEEELDKGSDKNQDFREKYPENDQNNNNPDEDDDCVPSEISRPTSSKHSKNSTDKTAAPRQLKPEVIVNNPRNTTVQHAMISEHENIPEMDKAEHHHTHGKERSSLHSDTSQSDNSSSKFKQNYYKMRSQFEDDADCLPKTDATCPRTSSSSGLELTASHHSRSDDDHKYDRGILGNVKLKKCEVQPATRVIYTTTTENYTSTGSDQTYESEGGNDVDRNDGINTKKSKQRLKPANFTKIKEEESSSESGGSRESRESYETQESKYDEVARLESREELESLACLKSREKIESKEEAELESRASLDSREDLDSNESVDSSRRESLKSENSYKSGASRERTESVDEIDEETDESYEVVEENLSEIDKNSDNGQNYPDYGNNGRVYSEEAETDSVDVLEKLNLSSNSKKMESGYSSKHSNTTPGSLSSSKSSADHDKDDKYGQNYENHRSNLGSNQGAKGQKYLQSSSKNAYDLVQEPYLRKNGKNLTQYSQNSSSLKSNRVLQIPEQVCDYQQAYQHAPHKNHQQSHHQQNQYNITSHHLPETNNLHKTLTKSRSLPAPAGSKTHPDIIEYETQLFKQSYEITARIGVGGGGTVYAGTKRDTKLPVAVKQISKSKIKRWGRSDCGRRVPLELELLQRVIGDWYTDECRKKKGARAYSSRPPNIIEMHDWFERRSSFVMVMERPDSCIDLFDYINSKGPLAEDQARIIFKQVIKSVQACHAKGVCHRDVKDENILLNSKTMQVKLIDFGCGTRLRDANYTEFAGTPEFYPPEWYTVRSYDGRKAAVWSLGILLYTMIEGHVPFQRPKDIVRAKLKFARFDSLSLSLIDCIQWMVSIDADKRPTLRELNCHPWMEALDY